jgi:hypothetical protein
VGLDERELGKAGECRPAASGTALLDLGGPDCAAGFVVGEDVQVRAGSEPEDQVLEAENRRARRRASFAAAVRR